MSDTKRKISAWIPASLYDAIENAGYKSPTIAVTKGLELLVRTHPGDSPETTGHIPETIGDIQDTSRRQLETEISYLKKENERLVTLIEKAPDISEFSELKGLYEGKLQVIEEKDRRIEDLSKEVDRLDMFAHYFKNVEVKQIEAPGEKKKPFWKFW